MRLAIISACPHRNTPPITFTTQGGRYKATLSPTALEQFADALRDLPPQTIKEHSDVARMESRLRSGLTVLSQGDMRGLMSLRAVFSNLGPVATKALALTERFLEKWENRPGDPGVGDHFNDGPVVPLAHKFL